MADRNPRSVETREAEKRTLTWVRPSALPTPEPRDGLVFRWVRTSLAGKSDNPNVSTRFREGFTPVAAVDHPEMKLLPDLGSRFPDNIEVGGLMLCSIPEEIANGRKDYHKNRARQQIESVDNNYMRQSDSRMPVLQTERSSRTSFGK